MEDFDDIGLTKIGKKRVLEAFTEIKGTVNVESRLPSYRMAGNFRYFRG